MILGIGIFVIKLRLIMVLIPHYIYLFTIFHYKYDKKQDFYEIKVLQYFLENYYKFTRISILYSLIYNISL